MVEMKSINEKGKLGRKKLFVGGKGIPVGVEGKFFSI
jgi:hypothetical protein